MSDCKRGLDVGCTKDVVSFASAVLHAVMKKNGTLAHPLHCDHECMFSGPITRWLEVIVQVGELPGSVVVLAVFYLVRYINKNPHGIVLLPSNVHRLMLSSLMVASKFVEDFAVANSDWSRITHLMCQRHGFCSKMVNRMELEFLSGLRFELFCDRMMLDNFVAGAWKAVRMLTPEAYVPEYESGVPIMGR